VGRDIRGEGLDAFLTQPGLELVEQVAQPLFELLPLVRPQARNQSSLPQLTDIDLGDLAETSLEHGAVDVSPMRAALVEQDQDNPVDT
jgi:hypothetical protein